MKAASGSDPTTNPAEKTTDGGKSENSVLVESLTDMGFERRLIEKNANDLWLAGVKTI